MKRGETFIVLNSESNFLSIHCKLIVQSKYVTSGMWKRQQAYVILSARYFDLLNIILRKTEMVCRN